MAFALGALVAIALADVPAQACGAYFDEARVRVTPAPKEKPKLTPDEALLIAESAMEQDNPMLAAEVLVDTFPRTRAISAEAPKRDAKARHLMAVALARTNGFSSNAKTRAANLNWAIATLRQLAEARRDDLIVRAELGEALAKVPAHHAEALALLSSLAERDLLATGRAYGDLARLRAAHGDPKGALVAADRCRAMSPLAAACPWLPAAPAPSSAPGA